MGSSERERNTSPGNEVRDIPGYCTFCRSRCGTMNRVRNGRLESVSPLTGHPTGKAICPKGRAAPEVVHNARRLTRPLKRTRPKGDQDPGFEEISWDEALDYIADRLAAIAQENGPESVAFSFASPSAASISDSLPWLERFVWNFGSPNICWATELCNWHKDHTHKLTLGTGLPVPDYEASEVIVLWGHNPEKVWLAQAEKISNAVRQGAELVLIDPRKTGMTPQATQWLRVRPGTDGALALGLIRLMLSETGFDEAFVRQWSNAPFLVRRDTGEMLRASDVGTDPGDAFLAIDVETGQTVAIDTTRSPDPQMCRKLDLFHQGRLALADGTLVECESAFAHLRDAASEYTPERVAEICHVPADEIRQLAQRLSSGKRVSYYCWTGVGQHGNAAQTDRAIACLFALTGQFDQPGGNVLWPSIPVSAISDYAMLQPEQAAKALGLATRPLGPGSGGWVTGSELYTAILEAQPYQVRALVSFGSNMLSSHPDPARGRAALEALDLQVHCDLFFNPSAMSADIILPVNSAWERDGLRTGFEISLEAQQHLQLRPKMLEPIGESRSDFDIAAGLAERLGFGDLFSNGNWESAHNEILEPTGLTINDLRHRPHGISVPLHHTFQSYAKQAANGSATGFATPSRRIEFYSDQMHGLGYGPVPDFVPPEQPSQTEPLVLTTAKNGYFCHTQHRGLNTLHRKSPVPRIDMHPQAARQRGIAEGGEVELRRKGAKINMIARLDENLDPSVVVAEYGWWQGAPDIGALAYEITGPNDANYNSLADFERLDPISGAPNLRSMCCDVRPRERVAARWDGFRPLVVQSKVAVTENVTELTLASSDGAPLAGFKAGQFISLRPAKDNDATVSRSYSLVNLPETAPEVYRVAIRRHQGGALSGALSDVVPGEVVLTSPPTGQFTLPFENEFPIVLVATGIGITPFMGLLEHVARKGGPEIHLYYGSRNGSEHAYGDVIHDIAQKSEQITVRTFFSRPRDAETVAHIPGRLRPEHIDPALLARRARIYLCGPDEMIRAFRSHLHEVGVPAFEVFFERFTSPERGEVRELRPQYIHFLRQGKSLLWTPTDGSLLELAEKHGLTLPSGCRTGQCESCALRVLSGTVGHFVDTDIEAPEQCLSCQAFPLSDVRLDA